MTRRTGALVMGAVVLGGGIWFWLKREPGPEAARDRFLQALDERDWETLIAQLPEPELANYPSPSAAKELMRRVTARLPENAFAGPTFRLVPEPNLKNVMQYEIRFPHLAPKVDGYEGSSYFLLSVLHGQDGWRGSLEKLPVLAIMQSGGTRQERLRRFADDLKGSGLERYTVFPMRQYTTPEHLIQLAEGKDPMAAMFLAPGARL